MGRLRVVDLEAGGERALAEGVGVVAEEGVVVAQQGVVDGAVGVRQQQVLVLLDHLLATVLSGRGSVDIQPSTDVHAAPLTFTTMAA